MNIPLSSFGYVDVIGTAGTLIVVAAYFGTQMRFINSDDLVFPAEFGRVRADRIFPIP